MKSARVVGWFSILVVTGLSGCVVERDDLGAAGNVADLAPALVRENVAIASSRDTALNVLKPNQNFGTSAILDVNRTLVQFDQQALAGAVGPTDYVVSAQLKLQISNNRLRRGAAARAVSAFRLNKAWTETKATWSCAVDANLNNSRPDCSGPTAWSMGVQPPNPWVTPASASATITPLQTSVSFDLTSDVRAFLSGTANQGWVLYTGPLGAFADFADFASRETVTPPQLVLTVQRCSASLCDDGNACTVDSCSPVGECVYADSPNGSVCSDADACTQSDSCQAGVCVGASPVVCATLDQCHTPGSCDPSSGVCSNPELPSGAVCNDGNACTGGDQCAAGVCVPGVTDLCVPPVVVLNEAESNQGVPGDWAELYNAGTVVADVSGWIFKDADDTHIYTIPAGAIIPIGGYLVLDEAQFGFGLGQNEAVRLFTPSGTLVDSQSWGPHATTTYGRCPNGTGSFTLMTTSTKGAANDCSTPPTDGGVDSGTDGGLDSGVTPNVVLNEAESSGGVPGDWVEIYNADSVAADLSGWIFKDLDDTHIYTIPAGSVVAVGGYLVLDEAQFGFGLGQNEAVRLFTPSGALVDSQSWGPHATTTYGRCPNGSGAFTTMTTSTKGAANDCSTPPTDGGVDSGTDSGTDGGLDGGSDGGVSSIVVNESESSGGVPGDWAELYNTSSTAVDVSGWTFKDNDDTHIYLIPAGTVIAADGYLVIEEAQLGFGLGGAESNRLYDASGALVDSQSWLTHATTTYGRCPNGTGVYTTTTSPTKGAANDCSTPGDGGVDGGTDGGIDSGIAFGAWPGGNAVQIADEPASFGGNLSGLTYEPALSPGQPVLWAVQNSPAVLYKLVWNGSAWVSSASDGWEIGKTLVYTNGGGVPDCEGVTKADLGSTAIYVATERNNAASSVSKLSILRFDVSVTGTTLIATHDWDLTADLPVVGANLGIEAITFVPDSYLLANGFIDQSTSALYDPQLYPDHGDGVFLVGVEGTGFIYAYVLDHADGSFQRIATIVSGHVGVMGMEFDREVGQLWAHCDNTCNNRSTVLAIETNPLLEGYGGFVVQGGFERPSTMANLNNEGIAIASEGECSNGLKSIWWSDDGETDGHALRADSIPCGPLF